MGDQTKHLVQQPLQTECLVPCVETEPPRDGIWTWSLQEAVKVGTPPTGPAPLEEEARELSLCLGIKGELGSPYLPSSPAGALSSDLQPPRL